MQGKQDGCYYWIDVNGMGRITPSFRQLYEETISELKMELQAALGNSTLPTVCDKLNIMASIHNRKLIASLVRELNERDSIIEKFEGRIVSLQDQINQLSLEIKGTKTEEQDKKKESAII